MHELQQMHLSSLWLDLWLYEKLFFFFHLVEIVRYDCFLFLTKSSNVLAGSSDYWWEIVVYFNSSWSW